MDIQIETDVPLPKQNQPLPNLPLNDLLIGQSFFLATRGEDSDQRRKWVEALRQKVTRFQRRHQNQKKFSVCKAVKDGVEGMRVHCIKVPEMPINEDNEQAQPTGAYLQGADRGQLQPWEQ
tara:strand:- start:1590 stop:1952 length:363 start_codon:yes stop_codon:yes gene_type:complete